MKRADLRRRMRERRQELRAALAARQSASREKLSTHPAVVRGRARRRQRRLLSLLLLLLVVVVTRCECDEPIAPVEPPTPVEEVTAPPPVKKPEVEKPSPRPPVRKQVETRPRPAYATEAKRPIAWLDDFRLQVAARSPRLARCFDGAERPGALRWTASVNAVSGAVSDHELEPMGAGGGLGEEQRECALQVLSKPAYRLSGASEGALPERVSIAVEF